MDTNNVPDPVEVAQRLADTLVDLNALDGRYAMQRPGSAYQHTSDALRAVLTLILGGGPVVKDRADRVYEVLLGSGYESVAGSLQFEQRERDAATFPCGCGEYEYPLYTPAGEEPVWCECGLRIAQQRELVQGLS
jgi:hypothetical protein